MATFDGRVQLEGLFYPPSLFTNVTPASFIAQVEIFGPVLTFFNTFVLQVRLLLLLIIHLMDWQQVFGLKI